MFRGRKMALSGSNISIKLELAFSWFTSWSWSYIHFTSLHLKSVALFAIRIFRLQRSKMECLNKWNPCWGMHFLMWLSISIQVFFLMFINIFKVYVFCRFGRMFRWLRWDPVSESLKATDKVIGRHRLEEVPRTIAWSRRRICILSIVSTYSSTSLSSAITSDVHVMEDSRLIDNGISSSSTTTILTSQSVRAAVPPVLSADSRAFAVPSIVYNLNNCTVHNIGSSTWIYGRWHIFTCLVRCFLFWLTAFFVHVFL
jgi:hypothetical protein